MTQAEKYLIEAIKSYLNNTSLDMAEQPLLQEALKLAVKHNVANFYYYGLRLLNIGAEKIAQKYHLTALMQTAQQDVEFEICKRTLIDSKIRFLPFKGILIKKIYKNPDARSMADIDIFVDESSLEKIKGIMQGLGYVLDHSTDMHDSYIKKPALNIEFHKSFISRETDFNYKLEGTLNPFETAKSKQNGYEYNLTPEDEYIYMIIHSARHFHGSGMGIKMVVDAYMYNRFYKDLDRGYIAGRLKEIRLDKFEKRLCVLSQVWFGESKADNIDILFGEWILKGSAFGTKEQRELHEVVSCDQNIETAKKKRGIKLIFPSSDYLSAYYPWLKKFPFLLPLAWILRAFRLVFKDKKVKSDLYNKISVSEDKAIQLSKLYKELGFYD